ncbi:MAG: hypothetical protein WBB07_15550 [Mycobacterium sp.]
MQIEHDNQDGRDPLRAAFTDYRRAPRDVVPCVEHSVDDLQRLADGGATVQITHYSLDEHGISRHAEHVTITAPITRKDTNQ